VQASYSVKALLEFLQGFWEQVLRENRINKSLIVNCSINLHRVMTHLGPQGDK
jgi:hypothetical protein